MNARTRLGVGLAGLVLLGTLVACTEDSGAGATVGPSMDPAAASPSAASPAAPAAPSSATPAAAPSGEPTGSGGRGDYDY